MKYEASHSSGEESSRGTVIHFYAVVILGLHVKQTKTFSIDRICLNKA